MPNFIEKMLRNSKLNRRKTGYLKALRSLNQSTLRIPKYCPHSPKIVSVHSLSTHYPYMSSKKLISISSYSASLNISKYYYVAISPLLGAGVTQCRVCPTEWMIRVRL